LNKDIDEMERLISQTLLLAKGLGSEKLVDTDVCDLLNNIINETSQPTKDVHKRFTGNCRAPVKAQALKRVVGNLLENALNYGGTRPVTLTYRRDKDHLTISVADQGPGIPPAEREAIFQPFHRLETSRSKATGGSGLGLAIIKQLCDANQWRIHLVSTEGEGSEFTITVPLPPPET
jgi:two-component system osmolarity sensor histidine kinase EnvZ